MGARPKLAYIINSLEGGGAQSPVPDILSVLQANGFDVQFYALTRRNGKAIKAIEASGFSPIIRPGGEKDHLAAVKWLMDELGKWPADIIWTSLSRATLLGQIVGQRLGLPVVSWQHNAFLKPWNERLLRWRAQASALWVADSHLVAQLTHERLGIAKDNLLTWSIFSADESAPTAAPWQKGETLRIGSLGRYHRAKGFDILIEALNILRKKDNTPHIDYRIILAGEGQDRHDLQKALDTYNIDNVDLAGFHSHPEEFLSGLHLYVQPSRREGFCIAAHEAMLAGLPVIVADTGEMANSVRLSKAGSVVAIESAEELAAALDDMLAKPQQLHIKGQAARAGILEHYSAEKFAATGADIAERVKQLLRAQ